jgi:hypothetical protein
MTRLITAEPYMGLVVRQRMRTGSLCSTGHQVGPHSAKIGPANRLEALRTLGGGRDRSVDREIVSQARKDERVSAGWKRKARIPWAYDDHLSASGETWRS